MWHCGNTGAEWTQKKSQHTKLTPEKNIFSSFLPGLEIAAFRSRLRRSANKLSRLPGFQHPVNHEDLSGRNVRHQSRVSNLVLTCSQPRRIGLGIKSQSSSSSPSAFESLGSCGLTLGRAVQDEVHCLFQVLAAAPQLLPQARSSRPRLALEGVVGWTVLKDVFRGLVLQVCPLRPVWDWALWGGQF